MVGPNNAGSLRWIAALKTAGLMLDHASRFRPQRRENREKEQLSVHDFNVDRFGLEEENVRYDFREVEASFTVEYGANARLTAVWPAASKTDPFFFLKTQGGVVLEAPTHVRQQFPTVGVVPAVVPLESRESVLAESTVQKDWRPPRRLGTFVISCGVQAGTTTRSWKASTTMLVSGCQRSTFSGQKPNTGWANRVLISTIESRGGCARWLGLATVFRCFFSCFGTSFVFSKPPHSYWTSQRSTCIPTYNGALCNCCIRPGNSLSWRPTRPRSLQRLSLAP